MCIRDSSIGIFFPKKTKSATYIPRMLIEDILLIIYIIQTFPSDLITPFVKIKQPNGLVSLVLTTQKAFFVSS